MAWWLNPATFWWAAITAVGLTYSAMALLLFTLFAFGLGYKGIGIFHLFLLAAFAIRIFPPAYFEEAKPQSSDLRLLNYNIAYSTTQARTDEYKRSLSDFFTNDPEIVVLNEQSVYRDKDLKKTITSLPPKTLIEMGYEVVTPQQEGYANVFAQGILFKGIEHEPYGIAKRDRQTGWSFVVRAPFTYQGKEAVLYAVHLKSLGTRKPWNDKRNIVKSKKNTLEYIRQYRDAYKDHVREVIAIKRMLIQEKRPFLVVGDFNATMHNWEYRHLARGLQDVYLAKGKGWGGTYRNDYPFVRIDFALASKEWLPVAAKTLPVHLSDHLPLLAQLRWRK